MYLSCQFAENCVLSILEKEVNLYRNRRNQSFIAEKTNNQIGGELLVISKDETSIWVVIGKRVFVFEARNLVTQVSVNEPEMTIILSWSPELIEMDLFSMIRNAPECLNASQ